MSHQSGITGAEGLEAAFAQLYNSEATRLQKITIVDEKLTPGTTLNAQGDWREDWDNVVMQVIEDEEPCYMLFRLDTKNASGFDFVFIAWSPDDAHIRKKMVYASTRATCKQIFGSQYIKHELFGTSTADISLEGYDKFVTSENAPPPLTAEELEKKEIRKAETGVDIGASTRRQVATGVSFPIDDSAVNELNALKKGKHTYVQLQLNLSDEVIELAHAGSENIDEIAGTIPSDAARYHVFNFKHNHEGDNLESIVFVYSCPGYSCSIKERMMYSTCKGPLIDVVEDDLKIPVEKKLEIGEASEFTQEWLYEQLHPAKVVFQQKFKRPMRPGKGGRRLIRNKEE